LNNVIVIKDLDIFEKVGRGVAHDEIVPFQIRQNKILINGKSLPYNNEIRVEFIKVSFCCCCCSYMDFNFYIF
jgi:hypothetical protein